MTRLKILENWKKFVFYTLKRILTKFWIRVQFGNVKIFRHRGLEINSKF